ncbi:spry domain containing socs box protein [Anaeramoeba flamelloides]|uniref:Spry domain containing socs box protein n=1 Tax=Anaeramoeba flamelloides TaxID=1746091 RepID=A0AAV8A8S6_9EUKA|nr:spry domain containing socs box protein [Anaeramoeba flamelloides]
MSKRVRNRRRRNGNKQSISQKKPKNEPMKRKKNPKKQVQKKNDRNIPVEQIDQNENEKEKEKEIVAIKVCQVCQKEEPKFFCSVCQIAFCPKCETKLHTDFLRSAHKQFVSKFTNTTSEITRYKNPQILQFRKEFNEEIDLAIKKVVNQKIEFEKLVNKSLNILNVTKSNFNQRIEQMIVQDQRALSQQKTVPQQKNVPKQKNEIQKEKQINTNKGTKLNLNGIGKAKDKFVKGNDEKVIYRNQNRIVETAHGKVGFVCGTFSFWKGIKQIKIKILEFAQVEKNSLELGIVAHSKSGLIAKGELSDTYCFRTLVKKKKCISDIIKRTTQREGRQYGKPLKKGDVLHIVIDMNKLHLYFAINNQNLGLAFENIPKKVCFFARLQKQKALQNKIQILWK